METKKEYIAPDCKHYDLETEPIMQTSSEPTETLDEEEGGW